MKYLILILGILFAVIDSEAQINASRHTNPFFNSFYVDSQYGDDNNNGYSEGQAFATLTKLQTVIASGTPVDNIYLKCGSFWRESLVLGSAFDDVVITSYGAGRWPIISGASIQGSWSKTAGRTNVYEAGVTKEAQNEDDFPVYENGVLLLKATDLANCDATPGSYFYVENSPTNITFYVHTTNSDNPLTNGIDYEVTIRHCIDSGDDVRISKVHTEKSSDRAGSTVGALNLSLTNSIIKDGTSHNMINAGGITENVLAFDLQEQSAGATMFVSYEDTPQNLTAIYNNCFAVNTNENVPLTSITAFYAHGSGLNEWQKIIIDNSLAYRTAAVSNAVADSLIITNGSFQKVRTFSFSSSNAVPASYQLASGNQLWVIDDSRTQPPTNGQWYNNAFYLEEDTNVEFIQWDQGETFDMQNCVIYTNDRAVMRQFNPEGSGQFNNSYNVYFGRPNTWYQIEADSLEYTGDYNIYFALNNGGADEVKLRLNGTVSTVHTTLAAWIEATGEDQNSVWLTAEQAEHFWVGDPTKGDFRINPDAEVTWVDPGVDTNYNTGDDVIRTSKGFFPDGTTKITAAGVLTGFPIEWRKVPMSVDDFYKMQSE
jgi:hypothetical protein